MVTYLLYTKGSEHEQQVLDFQKELERRQVTVELIEADSPRGIGIVESYDLVRRPSVVVSGPDGTAMERWMGELPPAGDVSYLFHR